MHKITEQMQLKELANRVPPILNVNIVLYKKQFIGKEQLYSKDTYLVGQTHRFKHNPLLFPGGRVKYNESPQEAAERILKKEIPGIKARLRKHVTTTSDKGYDPRAYGVSIYILFEYISGKEKITDSFEGFKWLTHEEMKLLKTFHPIDLSVMNEVEATVRTMNTSQDEILVEVDKNNKEIGTIPKREAHTNPKRFHRAVHIIIFDSKGRVILQQRSLTKSTGAGLWDMHGGHQVSGQTIEQTAIHELAEELGISTKLTLKRIGLYQNEMQSEYYYLYYGINDGPYGFDRNEVAQIKVFDCEQLLKHKYDKEYKILAHVYKYVEELKSVWEKLCC